MANGTTEQAFDGFGSGVASDAPELSLALARLQDAAQQGAASLAECRATLRAIDPADETAWVAAWTRAGDSSAGRARAALAAGHVASARRGWLHAVSYYLAALHPFDGGDPGHAAVVTRMRACARSFVLHQAAPGQIVAIPWRDGHALEAYFLPPPGGPGPVPAVLCMAEPGQYKEDHLSTVLSSAGERGMAVLIVDLCGGDEAGMTFDDLLGRTDLHTAIGCAMDHLVGRDGVDANRVAVFSDRLQSSVVARGIAADGRCAAAVCDGGLWDMQERAFLRERWSGAGAALWPLAALATAAIGCPVLIPARSRGGLLPERMRQFHRAMIADGRDVTLRIFSNDPGAFDADGPIDPGGFHAFVFDWLETRLTRRSRRDRAARAVGS